MLFLSDKNQADIIEASNSTSIYLNDLLDFLTNSKSDIPHRTSLRSSKFF